MITNGKSASLQIVSETGTKLVGDGNGHPSSQEWDVFCRVRR